jgi:uncharacterized protein (TIGR02996 family)
VKGITLAQGAQTMRTFVYTEGTSNKFWNIDLQGNSFSVTFGKIGTRGQSQTKDFPDEEKARKAHDKLVAEKLAKGYVETTARAPSPLQQSLEQALVENPDDLAAHSAHADYLIEQGDPRGEFIQVQLALEDPRRPASERKQLQEREAALLKTHTREWLGNLSPFLVGQWSDADKPYHYRFARGWLDTVRVLPFHEALFRALARSPQIRLLRNLEVVYDMRFHPFDFEPFLEGINAGLSEEEQQETDELGIDAVEILPPLLASPYLTNLRRLKVGYSDAEDPLVHSTMMNMFEGYNAQLIIDLLAKCPHLEELYLNAHFNDIEKLFALPTLGNLRVLQYYFAVGSWRGDTVTYPLGILAENASLKRLTTLRLHPGRDSTIQIDQFDALLHSTNLSGLTHLQVHMTTFGDEGPRRIIKSGILRRIKILDIGHGTMTDEGARILAGCPDLKHLERLDVRRNALMAQGVAALQAVGIQVMADAQHEEGNQDFLGQVDVE